MIRQQVPAQDMLKDQIRPSGYLNKGMIPEQAVVVVVVVQPLLG